MRIIASPVYRAFPELDGFTDEQCRAYLALARGGRMSRILFQAVRAAAVAVTALLAVRASYEIPMIGGGMSVASYFLPVVIGVAVAGLSALVWRDLMLRFLVVQALGASANCRQCWYRLTGLSVSPGPTVTCPECGTATDVSPLAEHCVPGIDGTLRFLPPPSAGAIRAPFLTPRRKAALRRLALVTAAAVLVPAALVTLFALAESMSARSDAQRLMSADAVLASLCPPGVPPDAPSVAGSLADLAGAVSLMDQSLTDTLNDPVLWKPWAGSVRWGAPAPMVQVGTSPSQAFARVAATRVPALADAAAACPVAACTLSSGVDDRIRFWVGGDRQQAVGCLFRAAKLRLWDCAERRDAPGFVQAVEWLLSAMRIVLGNHPFICGGDDVLPIVPLVAEFLRAADDARWPEALAAAVDRQAPRPMDAAVVETMAQAGEGLLSTWFASPVAAVWPKSAGDPRVAVVSRNNDIVWSGVYWQQRSAVRAHARPMAVQMLADPSDRDPAVLAAGRAAMASAGPTLDRFGYFIMPIAFASNGRADLRAATPLRALSVVIALERFRRAEGRLPAALDELAPRFLPFVPKDPFAAGTFGWRVLPAASCPAAHPGYVLWSVGPDGIDGGGDESSDVVLVPPPRGN